MLPTPSLLTPQQDKLIFQPSTQTHLCPKASTRNYETVTSCILHLSSVRNLPLFELSECHIYSRIMNRSVITRIYTVGKIMLQTTSIHIFVTQMWPKISIFTRRIIRAIITLLNRLEPLCSCWNFQSACPHSAPSMPLTSAEQEQHILRAPWHWFSVAGQMT